MVDQGRDAPGHTPGQLGKTLDDRGDHFGRSILPAHEAWGDPEWGRHPVLPASVAPCAGEDRGGAGQRGHSPSEGNPGVRGAPRTPVAGVFAAVRSGIESDRAGVGVREAECAGELLCPLSGHAESEADDGLATGSVHRPASAFDGLKLMPLSINGVDR